ncbi:hypothetical protein Pelo_18213 [Pelomyxa schiedti]|nr:hypothetical protein Pelo_18213 [Pelomyxa schiedti]
MTFSPARTASNEEGGVALKGADSAERGSDAERVPTPDENEDIDPARFPSYFCDSVNKEPRSPFPFSPLKIVHQNYITAQDMPCTAGNLMFYQVAVLVQTDSVRLFRRTPWCVEKPLGRKGLLPLRQTPMRRSVSRTPTSVRTYIPKIVSRSCTRRTWPTGWGGGKYEVPRGTHEAKRAVISLWVAYRGLTAAASAPPSGGVGQSVQRISIIVELSSPYSLKPDPKSLWVFAARTVHCMVVIENHYSPRESSGNLGEYF